MLDLYQLETALPLINLKESGEKQLYLMGIEKDIEYLKTDQGRKRMVYFQPYFTKVKIINQGETTITIGRIERQETGKKVKEIGTQDKDAERQLEDKVLAEGKKVSADHYCEIFYTGKGRLPGGYHKYMKIDPETGMGYRDYYFSTGNKKQLLKIDQQGQYQAERSK